MTVYDSLHSLLRVTDLVLIYESVTSSASVVRWLTRHSWTLNSLANAEWLNSQKSESELRYDWRFTANQFVLVTSPLWLATSNFIFQLNTYGYNPYETSSLARGWVCHLQLLLVLASAVILTSESRGTHDHLLLSQIRDSPNLEGQDPVFISPKDIVAQLYAQALGSLFVDSYDPQGYCVGIRPFLRLVALALVAARLGSWLKSESESYVTTDGQSACLSWIKAPIWGLWPDFYYRQTVAILLIWGALSDERTGLSFTIAAGPRQRSHSLVWVPWNSRPYFTVSD
jgi:hypothetical protein